MFTLKKIGLILVDITLVALALILASDQSTGLAAILIVIYGGKQYMEGVEAGIEIGRNGRG